MFVNELVTKLYYRFGFNAVDSRLSKKRKRKRKRRSSHVFLFFPQNSLIFTVLIHWTPVHNISIEISTEAAHFMQPLYGKKRTLWVVYSISTWSVLPVFIYLFSIFMIKLKVNENSTLLLSIKMIKPISHKILPQSQPTAYICCVLIKWPLNSLKDRIRCLIKLVIIPSINFLTFFF